MRLLDEALIRRFSEIGQQENVADPLIIARFYNPTGAGTWYATEYDPEERVFFGYVSLYGDGSDEWGYFSLDELEAYTGVFNLGIERDLMWEEKPASQIFACTRESTIL